ncbi:MAG: type II toxin-antitoxin system HicB family antitoxin [Methanosarcinales archaeon Met12]|nr:MAG: type II toxin-antitoxin system HicB family antitoxin [Methanosarcinales archaeon Met12]
MEFKVVIREDKEDGGYNVSCPALPGCHSQGETIEEALENIKEAIQGCIEVLNQRAKAVSINENVVEVAV